MLTVDQRADLDSFRQKSAAERLAPRGFVFMSGAVVVILFWLQQAALFAIAWLLAAALKASVKRTPQPVTIRPRFHQDFRRPVRSGPGPRCFVRGPPVLPPLRTPVLPRGRW